jgi:hypothetical protein
MKKILTHVTVTGADDSVKVGDLLAIAEEYPYVEFGILLSESQAGNPRFPSKEWLTELLECEDRDCVAISGHICGKWMRGVFTGTWPRTLTGFNDFTRWQLNTHGILTETYLDGLKNVVESRTMVGEEIIFQYDNVNSEGLRTCYAAGLKVSALFDLSHGAGVLPDKWPKPLNGIRCGYAGGLSPNNVAEQLTGLEQVTNGPTWIDAETHLRSSRQVDEVDIFDLAKVRAFLESARPWVIGDA